MKRLLSIFLLLPFLYTNAQKAFDAEALLKKRPASAQLVNDFTGTLTADQLQTLEKRLDKFDDSTSTQIAVVIIPTLNDYEIADYGVQLYRAWGIGSKKNNNGALLLIAKNEHRLNITTGYGLEGALPDVTCKEIIDDIIVPQFKGEDYYNGINQGVTAMMQASRGEYTAPEGYHKGTNWSAKSIIALIIIIIIIIAISSGGGRGGSFMSRRGFTMWTIGNMLGGGGRDWSGGGGGGWSGGGGGFGGFGGGSSGGGGASGSW
ncbi:MAG: TPM domain-containing protein [Bacteroidetes bacterium]|nr:TPM domain-containing protein [Bacteroidota bacterium]